MQTKTSGCRQVKKFIPKDFRFPSSVKLHLVFVAGGSDKTKSLGGVYSVYDAGNLFFQFFVTFNQRQAHKQGSRNDSCFECISCFPNGGKNFYINSSFLCRYVL